jgi:hypothetical protein
VIVSKSSRLFILSGIVTLLVVMVFLFPPLAQDPTYNRFADQRGWAGIPNALNVLSNIPFFFIGIWGIWNLFRGQGSGAGIGLTDSCERWAFVVFFAGVTLTSSGSAYYHWAPTNTTLVWDRVPMAIGFMGLLSAVVAERINLRIGYFLLAPLVAAGIGSVLYWHWSELGGKGDLRPYIFVQYASLVIILYLVIALPPRYTRGGDFIIALALYGLAKAFEVFDAPVMSLGRVVSGHTLKHFAAAAAIAWLLRMLRERNSLVRIGPS